MATTTLDPASLVTNSAITDPTALATSIAGTGWNDWKNNLSPYLQSQVQNTASSANVQANTALTNADQNHLTSNQMTDDYNNIYRPAGAQFGGVVDMLGSNAYRDQQRGKAVGGVQQNIDSAQDQTDRNLQRSGVDPSSGRALAIKNQNAIAGAAAKAGAANAADATSLQQYTAGLEKMNSMGLETAKAANAMDANAQKWASLGLDSAKTGANLGMDYAKLAGSQADSYGNVAARAGLLANNNATTASNIQATKDSNSIPNLLLSGLVKSGSTALNSAATSGTNAAIDWLKNKAGGTTTDWSTYGTENAAPVTTYVPSEDDWYMN